MKNNKKIARIGKLLLDILEIYIPMIMFLMLFAAFLIGIVFRYVFKNPQSWTFELSSICYLAVGVLSWGITHRSEDNVVFDMLYIKMSPKWQCIWRIVSNVLIAVVAAILIVPSLQYLQDMFGLKTQIIKIPRFLVFLPFTVSFVVGSVRSVYRAALDMKAFSKKEYTQTYGKKEENECAGIY